MEKKELFRQIAQTVFIASCHFRDLGRVGNPDEFEKDDLSSRQRKPYPEEQIILKIRIAAHQAYLRNHVSDDSQFKEMIE